MTSDTKKIVDRIAAAIAATWIFTPAAMRAAAEHIQSPAFGGYDEDQAVIAAFAALLERRAADKDRSYRETFGPRGDVS